MKKIIYKHPTIVIGALVVVFVGIIIAFYSWAIGDAVSEINTALAPPAQQGTEGFDLSAASKLDLRGLVSTSSISTGTGTPAGY